LEARHSSAASATDAAPIEDRSPARRRPTE
jgi:hypothetical protein